MSMPRKTGLQIYNSFSNLQKNGEKNENFLLKRTIFRIIYYFYISETYASAFAKGNRKH